MRVINPAATGSGVGGRGVWAREVWGGEGDNGRGERESGQVTGGGLARDPKLRVVNPVARVSGVVRRGGWAREVWGGEGDNGRGAWGSTGKVLDSIVVSCKSNMRVSGPYGLRGSDAVGGVARDPGSTPPPPPLSPPPSIPRGLGEMPFCQPPENCMLQFEAPVCFPTAVVAHPLYMLWQDILSCIFTHGFG